MGKCKFSSLWLSDERFKAWLAPVVGRSDRARCNICSVDFDISNMGVAAVVSHMKGKKHCSKWQESLRSPLSQFFRPVSTSSAASLSSSPSHGPAPASGDASSSSTMPTGTSTLSSFVSGEAVLSAELYWALNVVDKNYS